MATKRKTTLSEAAKIIGEKYALHGGSGAYEIPTGLWDRGFESVSIFIGEENGYAELNDIAEIANGIGDFLTETELKNLAEKYGFSLRNWHIVKPFEGIEDVDAFVSLAEELLEKGRNRR